MNRKDILLLFFTLVWFLDTLFTCMGVVQYGYEYEANPLMRTLMEWGGLLAFCAVKVVVWWFFLFVSEYMKDWIIGVLSLIVLIPVILGGIIVL